MTTAAVTSTNLTSAVPLKLSQRVRIQLTAANTRIDQETAKVRGRLTALAKRMRALFPVPSRTDIAELSARLERLEKEIDRLAGARAVAAPAVAEKRVRKPKSQLE